jgi:branched-chain amino acid transport system ATP-binding protein
MTASRDVPLLVVEELTKRYYGLTAVDGLSFAVPASGIIGLIGPNGSGKSTSVDCISGFQAADGGRWFLDGVELTGLPPYRHATAGLSRTFQEVRAYDELSLLDNLTVAAQEHDGHGWWAAFTSSPAQRRTEAAATRRAAELLALVNLDAYAQAPASVLSYGQRKLLAIAAAMMSAPKIIVLDEPVAGVNPTMIRQIEGIVRRLNGDGVALLLIEHNLDFIMNLCHRIIVLEQGRKIAEGLPAAIRSDPRVLAAYIGVDPRSASSG